MDFLTLLWHDLWQQKKMPSKAQLQPNNWTCLMKTPHFWFLTPLSCTPATKFCLWRWYRSLVKVPFFFLFFHFELLCDTISISDNQDLPSWTCNWSISLNSFCSWYVWSQLSRDTDQQQSRHSLTLLFSVTMESKPSAHCGRFWWWCGGLHSLCDKA